MHTGINNWVLYIYYLQKVKNKVMPYRVFFTPVLKHLHNLPQKSNVLHINGTGYTKENNFVGYIGSGCRIGLYSNKQISYQGQSKVIAKSNNSSS